MTQSFINRNSIPTLSGIGAPTVKPSYIGQIYIDTLSGNIYMASNIIGVYNWGFIGSGSTSSFNVNTIPGVTSWYKADNVTKDGGNNVTQWNDSGPGALHLNTVVKGSTTSPVWNASVQNGNPGIYFDGTCNIRYFNASGISQSQPYSIYIVIRPTVTDGVARVPISFNGNIIRIFKNIASVYAVYYRRNLSAVANKRQERVYNDRRVAFVD